jgi:hypothetical protein
MPCKEKHALSSVVDSCTHEIPLDELEDRLEMQQMVPIESAVACYTDFCPSDCSVHCGSGFSGCTDLCACDGIMCAAECGTLCVVDSCLVDVV